MTVDPKVLIAAHPTRGIDVGAQAAVWEEVKGHGRPASPRC
jgi:simple sugar transport system ATP-binding protein